ncbi:hypothetical protein CDD83_3635 [Cordyceps sp. RAO-2017]|nr:hypothetical protein CDD83_3635 [Cordyceps sp. RAO-2017]
MLMPPARYPDTVLNRRIQRRPCSGMCSGRGALRTRYLTTATGARRRRWPVAPPAKGARMGVGLRHGPAGASGTRLFWPLSGRRSPGAYLHRRDPASTDRRRQHSLPLSLSLSPSLSLSAGDDTGHEHVSPAWRLHYAARRLKKIRRLDGAAGGAAGGAAAAAEKARTRLGHQGILSRPAGAYTVPGKRGHGAAQRRPCTHSQASSALSLLHRRLSLSVTQLFFFFFIFFPTFFAPPSWPSGLARRCDLGGGSIGRSPSRPTPWRPVRPARLRFAAPSARRRRQRAYRLRPACSHRPTDRRAGGTVRAPGRAHGAIRSSVTSPASKRRASLSRPRPWPWGGQAELRFPGRGPRIGCDARRPYRKTLAWPRPWCCPPVPKQADAAAASALIAQASATVGFERARDEAKPSTTGSPPSAQAARPRGNCSTTASASCESPSGLALNPRRRAKPCAPAALTTAPFSTVRRPVLGRRRRCLTGWPTPCQPALSAGREASPLDSATPSGQRHRRWTKATLRDPDVIWPPLAATSPLTGHASSPFAAFGHLRVEWRRLPPLCLASPGAGTATAPRRAW